MKKLRAFISVTDKSNLAEWKRFTDAGHEIVSTGGTAKELERLGIPVTPVEKVTGFPEILDGRVKSMHPLIAGGMLGDTNLPQHVAQMAEHKIEPFHVVVVNLYDFQNRPSVENIDIGGPAAIRSAAKNGGCVAVVISPHSYTLVINQLLVLGEVSQQLREELVIDVFEATWRYDKAIYDWLMEKHKKGEPFFTETAPAH